MASSLILAMSLPQKQLTTSSSVATVGGFRLPPPEKLANLLDRSESVDEVHQIQAAILRHNLFIHRYHPVLNLKLHRAYASHGKIRHSLALFHQTIDPDLFLFNDTWRKDIVAWNAMIAGYAMHGYSQYALRLFDEMQGILGLQPTDITFIATLQACAHAGLVNEGVRMIESMGQDYGIKHKIEHYGCLVSLLGRADPVKTGL